MFGSDLWWATVTIDNPLPVCQCIEYTPYKFEARAWSSLPEVEFVVEVPGFPKRLAAPPMQQVFAEEFWNAIWSVEFTQRTHASILAAQTGPRFVTFADAGTGGGFDTFGIAKSDCACNGGFVGAQPFGFSSIYVKFELQLTWYYHWIPSSCPVDLTTLSTAGSQFYGEPDGIVDSHDFFYYLDQFALGNLAVADLTTNARPGLAGYGVPNGAITNDDFFYFLLKYVEGC